MLYEFKNLKALNEAFKRLNNLRRWTSFLTDGKYDEIAKQSLNWCICFILAAEMEARGNSIRWELFPKIAVYRAFEKAYVYFDTPERVLKEIYASDPIRDFNIEIRQVTPKKIAKLTDEEFAQFVSEGCGTYEEFIYKAATKIATYVELLEIKSLIKSGYRSKYNEIKEEMSEYLKLPEFKKLKNKYGKFFKTFMDISKLRNQNRWAIYSYSTDCSVLGHLFDTAVFGYFLALEDGYSEIEATHCFFLGIFHDVAETYTKDIPATIKDELSGFRNMVEQYEQKMLDTYFYPKLSKTAQKAVKSVMFETEENSKYKTLIKGADYISAVSEIWRQFKSGTRDHAFIDAMEHHKRKFENSEITKLTSSFKEFYEWLQEYAESLQI